MRARDVIAQLLQTLPQLTDKFTDTVALQSVAHAEPTLTVNTSVPHNLRVGNQFHLVGVKSTIQISSFTRAGAVGTITFARAHDRILHSDTSLNTVTVSGATEAEFNGTFVITAVPNRTTMTVTMTDAGPTTATGSPVAEDADSFLRDYNRLYSVATITDTDTFTATTTITGADAPVTSSAELRVKPRITGAIDLERAMETYTAQGADKLWAFVILGDVQASRGQEHRSDSIDRQFHDVSWSQQVVAPFSIVIMASVSNEIAARAARDTMTELWSPLCRSVLGSRFDSQLAVAQCEPVNFVGHGVLQYDRGMYVHGFSFEAVEELGFDDTIGYSDSVAFRDIDYTITPDLDASQGDGEMSGTIDLDESP